MRLNEQQKKIVEEKLSFFFRKPCEVCSGREWLMNDTIFELREFEKGKLIIGGKSKVFPVITVTCKSCGHTYFFNAILLGLVSKKDEEK